MIASIFLGDERREQGRRLKRNGKGMETEARKLKCSTLYLPDIIGSYGRDAKETAPTSSEPAAAE